MRFDLRLIISQVFILICSLAGHAQSRKPVLTLPVGHQQGINSLNFSKDGKLMVTGSNDNSFIVWDARTGFIIRRVVTQGPVRQVIITPDGSQLLTLVGKYDNKESVSQKNSVQKWDLKTGKIIETFPFTASPGLRFLRSGYLLVPNYDDAKKKGPANLLEAMMASSERGDDYEDSIDAIVDQRVEKLNLEEPDGTDPKKLAAYQKIVMDITMEVRFGSSSLLGNISVVDPKTFMPVATIKESPENAGVVYQNNNEYLLGVTSSLLGADPNGQTIASWEINNIIKQYRDKKTIEPGKEYHIANKFERLVTSPDNNLFAVDGPQKNIQLWQLDKNAPLKTFTFKGKDLINLEFAPGGDVLYVYSGNDLKDRFIEGWSTSTLQQTLSLKIPDNYLGQDIYLSPAGNYFAVNNVTGFVKFSPDGDSTGQFTNMAAIADEFGFDKNDQQVSVKYNAFVDITGLLKLSIEQDIEEEAAEQNKKLSKTEKEELVQQRMNGMSRIFTYNREFKRDWDLVRGGITPHDPKSMIDKNRISSSDKNYSLINEKFNVDNRLFNKLADAYNDPTRDDLDKDSSDIKAMQYLNGHQSMFETSKNGPVTLLINKKTRDSISLIAIDSTDWVMLLKKGYYMTSKNGARALSYTRDMDVFPFEQFDIQYNRPDLVLKAIGKSDTALIGAYHNAWQKRIKKLEIDTTQFNNDFVVPEADFGNRDKINHEQTTDKLNLAIVASDSKTTLDRFNIWVNEVPVFGKNGKSLKDSRSAKLNTSVEITLSQGKNRIETSVINASGVESYRSILFVNYTPAKPKEEKIYFIGIGINRFADSSHNLRYCEKDIRDLSQKLKEKYGNALVTVLLLNEDVTLEKVKAIKQTLLQSHEDDKVIVAYSGHGLLSKKFDYYLSSYNVNFNEPGQNGISYDELENLVDGIKARRKLMLIDACHSGELDKEEMQKIAALEATNKSTNNVTVGMKGLELPESPVKLGAKNSFELMQELFVNVGRGTGTTIVSAAAGTQFALEKGNLKNGVFTYSVLETINNYPRIKISDLKRIVGHRVEELTNGLQKPTSRNEMMGTDWEL